MVLARPQGSSMNSVGFSENSEVTVWTVRRKLNQFRQVSTPSATSSTAHPDKPVLMNMHA